MNSSRERVGAILSDMVFPVGLFLLLTGLFWVGRHSLYSKLFYWLLLLPAVVRITIEPGSLRPMLRSPIALAMLAFGAYMSLTTVWGGAAAEVFSLIRRPLFVLVLFYCVFELGRRHPQRLRGVLKWSGVAAAIAAAVTLVSFGIDGADGAAGRLTGLGALFNPLLVSHVFGFFIAAGLGAYFASDKAIEPIPLVSIALCGALVIATGSRTPLVAIVATVLCLSLLAPGRKAFYALGALLALGLALALLAPEMVLQRGASYRPEIWLNVARQVSEQLWFGHGYGTALTVRSADIPLELSDPHNLSLAVLYAGGIVGLALWALLYLAAFSEAWRRRGDPWARLCAATVVYGFAAGMTEGGSFFSRPEEHWFLIWIPLALLAQATCRGRGNGTEERNLA